MTLRGYSLPRSPEGRASLVPTPPWHYVGDLLVLEYWAEPDAVAAVLPEGTRTIPDAPQRCSSTGSRAPRTGVSCSTRRGASTASSSSSSTRCWTAST